jgi:hypothetical protein
MQRAFAALLPGLFLFLLASPALRAQEIVYRNSAKRLGTIALVNQEYGDQLELVGTARTLFDLKFEYFAEFPPGNKPTMIVRLYSNDKAYDAYRKRPTFLLYQSEPLELEQGYNTMPLSNLKVVMPDTVTLTVEFSGLTMQEGDKAGLLLYGVPERGKSWNEFWRRTSAHPGWEAFAYKLDPEGASDPNNDQRANMGVRMIAVTNVPPVEIHSVARGTDKTVVTVGTSPPKIYALEYRDGWDPKTAPWKRIRKITATTPALALEDPEIHVPLRIYRVRVWEQAALDDVLNSLSVAPGTEVINGLTGPSGLPAIGVGGRPPTE